MPQPWKHVIDAFYDVIKEWREHDEICVVIPHQLNERIGSDTVKDTALCDWCPFLIHFAPQQWFILRRVDTGRGYKKSLTRISAER